MPARTRTAATDVHAVITDQIIATLEAGTSAFELPWHRPGGLGRPTNAATGNDYQGVNILALWASAQLHDYAGDVWATYRQWASLGAQVRRGEHGTCTVFYRIYTRDTEEGEEERAVARASMVFNAAQVDGYTPPLDDLPVLSPLTCHAQADAFIVATGARIEHGGGRAFYRPSTDTIHLPDRERFTGTSTCTATEGYYSTALHELVHWAGTEDRCDRNLQGRFGSDAYAMEELVAEIGSAILCSVLGITPSPREDHAAYIGSWLQCLKNDKKAIFTAAGKASQAVAFLNQLQRLDMAA